MRNSFEYSYFIERNGDDVELTVAAEFIEGEFSTNTPSQFYLCSITPCGINLTKDEFDDMEQKGWDRYFYLRKEAKASQ